MAVKIRYVHHPISREAKLAEEESVLAALWAYDHPHNATLQPAMARPSSALETLEEWAILGVCLLCGIFLLVTIPLWPIVAISGAEARHERAGKLLLLIPFCGWAVLLLAARETKNGREYSNAQVIGAVAASIPVGVGIVAAIALAA